MLQKPRAVILYNRTMGGVDLSDAQLYMYLAERRTIKWTTKVAMSLFGRAILNAYLIYAKNTSATQKLSRHLFMVSVIEGLTEHYRPEANPPRRRRTQQEIAASRDAAVQPPAHTIAWDPLEGHDLVRLPQGKKRKCGSPAHGAEERVRSSWECPACDIGLCRTCFVGYHQRPRH